MDFAAARHNMVESQVKPNRVTNPKILDAIADLPREKFVPQGLEGVAYVDEALAMGDGRYMMEAMILGRLLQEADTTGEDIALVVGCGSGYEAAVLSRLAGTVVALEDDKAAADQANAKLLEQGIDTVAVVEGPLAEGYPSQQPYDVIFINGSVGEIPAALSAQLAEGGRLVAIVGSGPLGKATLMTNYGGVVSSRQIFDAGTPELPGFGAEETFSF
ncbi:MAG: protein-L-isoaspartate O-methyltransferase [Rhodospirillaceae bacterium]|nr:protein-L-isoaspartate O-methyltransferase [Rhodospirillaceae bacterium]MBT5013974.1 protein-L-isoaspartate O-methyltransferase [Rhodospirillaceae bacterium]MBT5309665.1 protein-L-isoaspartate O-methyltransferase [Rhodospirillaceae bacterium]MBT6407222.1 protein-L-isoaspartate O-methyltransferase [Rhodospirillaceae bacterium]MBT7356277.1 protein-L-isoaspartate O-methyltransferase [Rhodospirillaceae bacterium]